MQKYGFMRQAAAWVLAAAIAASPLAGAAEANYTAADGTVGSGAFNSIAIGANEGTPASVGEYSDGAIAIGESANASGNYTTAIGTGAQATASGGSAFGQYAVAMGIDSSAFGQGANAMGNYSSVFGQNAQAASGSSAFGQGARADRSYSVALGADSIADRQTSNVNVYVPAGASSGDINATVLGDYGVVSIGDGYSNTRQLTGVAAGIENTDAVNVAQLKALDDVALKYDDSSKTILTLNRGGSAVKLTNVAAGTAETDAVNYGQLSAVSGDVALNKTAITTVSTDVAANAANIAALDNVAVKYTAGSLNKLTFTDSGGGVKISNVAAGTAPTDAVNYGQLTAVSADVATNTTSITALSTSVASHDTRIAGLGDRMTLAEATAVSHGAQITGIGDRITTAETNIGTLNAAVISSDSKVGDLSYTSTKYVAAGMNVTAAISALDAAITTGVSGDIREVKDTVGAKTEYTSGNTISGAKSVIANLSALDAAQGDQQYAAVTEKGPAANGDSTTTAIGKLNNSVGDVSKYGSTNIVSQNESTVNNIGKLDSAMGDLKYNAEHSPAKTAGASSASAAPAKNYTGRVLDGDSVTAAIGKLNNSVGDVNAYASARYISQGKSLTDNISALDKQMSANVEDIADLYWRQSELSGNIEKVGAGSAALAGLHPLEYSPEDKVSFSAAYGGYGSKHALAAGMFYRPNENVIYSLATTLGNGKNQYNLGVSFSLGAKRAKKISAAEYRQMGETIEALNEKLQEQNSRMQEQHSQIQEQNSQIAALAAQLEELKTKVK